LCWRLRPEKKKVPVVCLAGCRLRPEKKKVPVVCLAGCQFLVLAIGVGYETIWLLTTFFFFLLLGFFFLVMMGRIYFIGN
jgi:hypothetical protein